MTRNDFIKDNFYEYIVQIYNIYLKYHKNNNYNKTSSLLLTDTVDHKKIEIKIDNNTISLNVNEYEIFYLCNYDILDNPWWAYSNLDGSTFTYCYNSRFCLHHNTKEFPYFGEFDDITEYLDDHNINEEYMFQLSLLYNDIPEFNDFVLELKFLEKILKLFSNDKILLYMEYKEFNIDYFKVFNLLC